ncbi:uncharacterized protein UV8b_07503 [Ustilaginoidea virens]|uniref:Uncharacterized protein n=1 Tax=Ustilaginoidea virens TaxID=1159556 RepID=A0A8E5HXG3_USTVR|nr:uncharacterized protein UV8b_07503 [Ustilaginoidea virens]QUC23262.1 hypothetical protein UV8b_07503 [Ustilaginoidea virens]
MRSLTAGRWLFNSDGRRETGDFDGPPSMDLDGQKIQASPRRRADTLTQLLSERLALRPTIRPPTPTAEPALNLRLHSDFIQVPILRFAIVDKASSALEPKVVDIAPFGSFIIDSAELLGMNKVRGELHA